MISQRFVLCFEYAFVTMSVYVVSLAVEPVRLCSLGGITHVFFYLAEPDLVKAAANQLVVLFHLQAQLVHVVLQHHVRVLRLVQVVLQGLE